MGEELQQSSIEKSLNTAVFELKLPSASTVGTPQTFSFTKDTGYATTDQFNKLSEDTGKKITEISNQAKDDFKELKKEYQRFEDKMNKANTLIVGLVVATFAIIAMDYFKQSGEQYEKFVDKTQEIKNGYPSKDELKNGFYSKEEVNIIVRDFKECIRKKGLSNCL